MRNLLVLFAYVIIYIAWLLMVGYLTTHFGAWGFLGGILLAPQLSHKWSNDVGSK